MNEKNDPLPSSSSSSSGEAPSMSANEAFVKRVAEKRESASQSEAETLLWSGGYSPKAMLGTWLSVIGLSIAMLVVSYLYQTPKWPIALLVVAILWLVVGLIYAYRKLGYHYELTTQRFIHQVGLLSRQTDRIEVIDIDDVSFRQGPVQRLLGVGTIDISGSDRSHPQLLMRGIANVKTVAGLIDDIRRKERKKRSLHIQSM